MDENGNGPLHERVERLEVQIGELRRELRCVVRRLNHVLAEREREASGAAGVESVSSASRSPVSVEASPARQDPASWETGRPPDEGYGGEHASGDVSRRGLPFDLGNLGSGEWWLNKVGIGLLLFGVAFLFMLAVDRGWLSPPVRVGCGLAVGVALLAIGLRVYGDRPAFSQVLLGGGVATLYITGFAAFQLYALVPHAVSFSFMVAVTLLAYVLSLRQSGVALSLIGALGGLGTPFLLYTEEGSLPGLVLYTCLILAGTGAIYLYKGWASLLAVSSAGGWSALLIGFVGSYELYARPSLADRWTLQLGVVFAWLLFGLAPVAREAMRWRSVGRHEYRDPIHAHTLAVSTPLVALAFTELIWELPASDLGWITLGASAFYALAAFALKRNLSGDLYYTHALVALLLLTLTLVLMLRDNVLFFTLAAEATVLHLLARRLSDRLVSAGAHLLFFVAAFWLLARIAVGAAEGPSAEAAIFNARGLVDLAVIVLTFGVSGFVLPGSLARVYRLAAHVALLAWLWRELSMLPGSADDAYVTVAWGLYAVGLLVIGLRLSRVPLVRVGMATLFLVVGKLFLVDLAQVEATWRVLLFLGFGGLFLTLSYYLRSLWRPTGDGR